MRFATPPNFSLKHESVSLDKELVHDSRSNATALPGKLEPVHVSATLFLFAGMAYTDCAQAGVQ